MFVDETVILFDKISVSAGARGAQLILAPDDYLRAAEAQTADLTKSVVHEEPAAEPWASFQEHGKHTGKGGHR